MIPDILALDFDGVLCEGMREYFETTRRTYRTVWPKDPPPGDETLAQFRTLRPVILTGWEMPVLLRAIVQARPEAAIAGDWPHVRDEIVRADPHAADLVATLGRTLDEVRRKWIAADAESWVALNEPYCALDELRRLVGEPERAVLVTTKEGEFARRILRAWDVKLADIQGKEAGVHKCENLRALIAAFESAHGRRPSVWFVEDRPETLEHVTTHPDLADVGLFLADWGYNTSQSRTAAVAGGRIRLLNLDEFRGGLAAWPAPA